jgi:hypothetical protein
VPKGLVLLQLYLGLQKVYPPHFALEDLLFSEEGLYLHLPVGNCQSGDILDNRLVAFLNFVEFSHAHSRLPPCRSIGLASLS